MLILATKLHIPRPRTKLVLRDDLVDRLDRGMQGKLTLVSAPAGFGKSTLLSHWVETFDRAVAWVSLDDHDSDQIRFFAYLIAAIQTIEPKFGANLLSRFLPPEPLPVNAVLTLLLNEIVALNEKIVLILDDYHSIKSEVVDDMLAFLIEHLPSQLHIVIATRTHPQLPFARLRSQGQLTELGAADLRFTPVQIREFFNQVVDLNLSPTDIDSLDKRTEGWAAGLQLAALALQGISRQGGQTVSSFIHTFAGDHHFVIDYLVEEVLQLQAEPVVDFLLQTSLLKRFCAPLCDATLRISSGSSRKIVDYLEQANLLIVPLDHQHQWYRYHHLFAEALQARLEKERPDHIHTLHVQASIWYEQNGFRADAIHHALAAESFERAADLIEQEWDEKSTTHFQGQTLINWILALPNEILENRPQLMLGILWELLFLGELEAAETRVNQLMHVLERATQTENTSTPTELVGQEEYQSLRASLAMAQAFNAQANDDFDGTIKYTRQALSFAPESDIHTQGLANALFGLASLSLGDLEIAYETMAIGRANLQQTGDLLFATTCTFVLANIRITQGRLRDAVTLYEQTLQLVSTQHEGNLPGTADLHIRLCELYHELGDKEKASHHLEQGKKLGQQAALPEWPYALHLAQARMMRSDGDLSGAVEELNRAEKIYQRSPVPNLRPVAALKAGLLIQQEKLDKATEWCQIRKLLSHDELSFLHEFEHMVLAKMLIAQYQLEGGTDKIDDALTLLDRLQQAAEDGKRNGSLIEIFILQGLAFQAQNNMTRALQSLENALLLAEPEGYVRLFTDEGGPMVKLLSVLKDNGETRVYIARLLREFDADKQSQIEASTTNQLSPTTKLDPMIEPLSGRELEVLVLIAAGKKNQEIADQLIISLNTVRYHTKNLYGKLGVNKRTQAVAKAQTLGLI